MNLSFFALRSASLPRSGIFAKGLYGILGLSYVSVSKRRFGKTQHNGALSDNVFGNLMQIFVHEYYYFPEYLFVAPVELFLLLSYLLVNHANYLHLLFM